MADLPEQQARQTIDAMLTAGLDAPEAFVGNEAGNAKEALSKAARVVEAVGWGRLAGCMVVARVVG